MLDQIKTLDLVNDATEQDRARWVTHPGVELAVWLVGAQRRVTVVVSRGLGLLGESNHIRGCGQIPVVVGPKLASGTDSGLYLVDDEENVVFSGKLAQTAEEGGRGVVVAAFGLDGLDDDGCRWVGEGGDETLDVGERVGFSFGILGGVFLEGVFEEGEGGLGPVEGGDIELVDGLGSGGREGTEEAAVEGGFEGEDREVGCTWEGVGHAG